MDEKGEKKFTLTKNEAEKFYRSIDTAHCPYFTEDIFFNAKGLQHIKFSRHNHARPREEQLVRFKLIHLTPQVIKLSHTLQGVSSGKAFERVKVNNRWETVLKNTRYYEFVAVLDEVRVRVIVKQIEGGNKYFWSIIPYWRPGKNRGERLLHSGRPEID